MNTTPLHPGSEPASAPAPAAPRQEKKLESLVTLAAGVAHDFSNYLTCILGNNSIVAHQLPNGSPLADHVRRIDDATKQAVDLTQQLYLYTGRIRLHFKEIDLNGFLAAVTPALQSLMANAKNVTLTCLPAAGLPPVKTDEERLRLAITNLVLNAVEALSEKPGTITVSAALVDVPPALLDDLWCSEKFKPGRCAAVTVADTGCGMTPAVLARAFDPFYTTRMRARGMGLPVALGIARAHHGAIQVATQPGHGSSITLLLPCPVPAAK